MKVKVLKKLVLGVNVYKPGDVFECREAEGTLLIATGYLQKMARNAEKTASDPKAPVVNLVPTEEQKAAAVAAEAKKNADAVAAREADVQRQAALDKSIREQREAQARANEAQQRASHQHVPQGRPVGAMAMPQHGQGQRRGQTLSGNPGAGIEKDKE